MIGQNKWFNDTTKYGFVEYNEDKDLSYHSERENNDYKILMGGKLIHHEFLKTNKKFQTKILQEVAKIDY